MAWTVEQDAEGRTIWNGKQSILNLPHVEIEAMQEGGNSAKGLGWSLVAAGVVCVFTGVLALIGLILLGMGAFGLVADGAHKKTAKWVGADWRLASDLAANLSYEATASGDSSAESWAVSVDQIASVEAGRTVEWQRARSYAEHYKRGGFMDGHFSTKPRAIPENEWQTFLVLTDQTRRVIHVANADREGCGALAASIRSHVEAARSSAPALPSSVVPAGDGFEL